MKAQNKFFAIATLLAFSGLAHADIKGPATVNCTATKITPEGAKFFGFGAGPKVGDRTKLDLASAEIEGLAFESGAHIGSTVTKHPLKKTEVLFEGLSHFAVTFQSTANGQHYEAVLVAREENPGAVTVSLDVLQKQALGRLTMNSIELDCVRN